MGENETQVKWKIIRNAKVPTRANKDTDTTYKNTW